MNKQELNWPRVPDFPSDAFKGTSKFYADFRPPYPKKLITDLLNENSKYHNSKLLDLGCGPGRVTLTFTPYYEEIWAIDPEKDMLEEGKSRTPEQYKNKIHWIQSTAESLNFPPANFQLITIGEAFHRMDQRIVAINSKKWLVPGGRIAILGYKHFWNYSEGWKLAVNEVLDRYKDNQAKKEIPNQEKSMTFEEVLEAVGFSDIHQREYFESKTWTEDEIIGYLFSVSTFSKRKLGDEAESFENDVRQALQNANENGEYNEIAAFQCLVAKIPT